jgi:hypothetical protein
MMLYDCISTGCERGLLQVVLDATTLGHILLDATDKSKAKCVLRHSVLSCHRDQFSLFPWRVCMQRWREE